VSLRVMMVLDTVDLSTGLASSVATW
jgi:hypothetical protein